MACFFVLLAPIFQALAVDVNIDTPNLSFEMGNFGNWSVYTGNYFYDDDTEEYTYEWKAEDRQSDRLKIMNQMDTPDPYVACSDLLVVPNDLSLTARLGAPGKTEGMPNVHTCAVRAAAYKAAAERMTYDFDVTENSTLLNYRFACVLHVPDNSAHSGNQLPMFQVYIHVINPETMQESTLPCGSYSATANDANSGLEKNPATCTNSASKNPDEYVFRKWTSGSINLQNFIGYHVQIEILNHDCLVDISDNCTRPHAANCAGGHESYGYFWAETRKLELIDKNCGLSDPTITAPEGFTSYQWKRSDGKSIATATDEPNVAIIPRGTLSEGVVFSCTMSSDLCSAGTATTDLKPVTLNMDFAEADTCGGLVRFTNMSTCEGDSINGLLWSFGDEDYSYQTNPEHVYASKGDSYTVKLVATTKLGCEDSVIKEIVIPYVPTLSIGGATNVCRGTELTLTVLDADEGSKIVWDDGAEGINYPLKADTSRQFVVTVIDKYSCSYSTTKNLVVRPVPVVYILGDSATCIGDSVTLVANNALTYSWNTGAISDSLVVRPQSTTTYTVVGQASNGCQAEASFTVKVNPLPVIEAKGPEELCAGETGNLVATGGEVYQWTDLFTGASRDVMPLETTKYTVVGTDKNKCSNTASWTVTVKDNPTLEFQGDTLICAGELARITVAGADNFLWGDGFDQNYYSKVLQRDTAWTVTGTTNGCSSSLTIPITIKPAPYVFINGNTQVCYGDSLILWGAGAETYQWATGQTDDTLKTIPAASAKYQVTGKGANGCARVATVDVTVLPLPTVSIVGDQNVCQNDLAHLRAQGDALVYYWNTGSISDSITPLITEAARFRVRGVDINNCSSYDSFDVGIIPPPVLSFTGETEICQGAYTMLVLSGASSYKWNNGATDAYYNASPRMDTTYVVTGFLNGCSSKLSIPIKLRQAPVVWAEGITQVCQGDTVKLRANGAVSYIWSNGTSGETMYSSPLTSCSFHLIGTDSLGCQGEIDIPVTVRLKPEISVTGTPEVCEGATATLNASGEAVLYSWSNGQVGQTINPIIIEETEFTVLGTDKHSCTNTATFRVKPVLPPTLSYLGDTAVCVGGTVDLVGQGASEYYWNDTIPGTEYVFEPKATTYVKLTGISHNCSSSKMLVINVLTPPNILISGDNAVCPGDKFTITAQGASKFRWSTGDTTASISYAPQVPTTYYATGEDVYGCSTTKSFTVEVRSLPNVSIQLVSYRGCPGSKDTAVIRANGASYYEWSSDPSLPELDRNVNSDKLGVLLDDTTTFYLYGRDLYGCANEAQLTLTPLPRQNIEFSIEPKWIEHSNPTISMKGVSPSAASWYWTPGDGSNEQEGRLFHYRYDIDDLADSVEVKVRAVDTIGCVYNGSEYLYVWKDFWAPTGFTPNNDEKNETFHFFGGQYITDFHFYIFNRQGEIVFEGNSFDAEWDGTYNGKDCPWGVYGWVANYNSNVKGTNFSGERKGFITVVR